VYEHPATEFVAGFLGASNLLPGSIEDRKGDLGVVTLTSGEKVRVPARALNGTGPRVKVGVRPEKIRILPGSELPEETDNAVRGRLRISTYVGVSSQYEVETPAGGTITVYEQNLGGPGRWAPGPGEDVLLAWHPEHTFVVEPEEGSELDDAEGGSGE
jgi:spermidine/putrescine transport system ATP-binding protein